MQIIAVRDVFKYEGDLITFVDIMSAKNNIAEYEGDVVTFVTNKIIIFFFKLFAKTNVGQKKT